jgi:hypothetical protein|tara:strand:- start:62 stop:832 length:771 start_codon:yes stop_codon:yes gene_type:complete
MNLDELRKLAGMPQTEWANSPATTAHPDPEEVQAPEADVNQSLRQYLNADPHPVKVVEGEEKVFEDHEVEDMMAKFKEYLNEDEAVEEQAQEEVVEQADETVEEGHVGTPHSLDKVEAQISKLKDMAKKARADGDPQKANDIESSDEMTELLRKQKKLKNESIEEAQVSEEPNEDNAFNTAAAQAKKAGKSEFEFNGKKYKVKMDDKTADALTDSVEPKVESQDIADLKKLAGIGETTTDQTVSADISALKKLAGI